MFLILNSEGEKYSTIFMSDWVQFRPDIYELGPQRTLWAGVGSWPYIKHRLSNDKGSPSYILCRTRKDKQHTSRYLTIKVFPIKESPINI